MIRLAGINKMAEQARTIGVMDSAESGTGIDTGFRTSIELIFATNPEGEIRNCCCNTLPLSVSENQAISPFHASPFQTCPKQFRCCKVITSHIPSQKINLR